MDVKLTEPRAKKGRKLTGQPLPCLRLSPNGGDATIKAVFNGFSVIVVNQESDTILARHGCFGNANLSRRIFRKFNSTDSNKTEIVRERVAAKRRHIATAITPKDTSIIQGQQIIVVPDSSASDSECVVDDDDNNIDLYFTGLRPQFQMDLSGVRETRNLGLEEAFFLADALNCMEILSLEHVPMQSDELWRAFQLADPYFVQNYLVYYYFRAKNWVVKSGFKFGGDFLLYKDGPPYYHASYLVIIDVVSSNASDNNIRSRRSMKMSNLMGLNRLCETTGKELLLCQLSSASTDIVDMILPPSPVQSHHDRLLLTNVKIKEVLVKRWLSPLPIEQQEN